MKSEALDKALTKLRSLKVILMKRQGEALRITYKISNKLLQQLENLKHVFPMYNGSKSNAI